MSKKVYKQQEELKHFGILGMHWGRRKQSTVDFNNQKVEATAKFKSQKAEATDKFFGNKPRPTEVRSAIGSGAKTVGNVGVNAAKGVVKAFQEKHKSRVESAAETKSIVDKANKILNNPKSSQKELDSALESIGVNPKTGKTMFTKPVYDKAGNDVSVNPPHRLLKNKGVSDKAWDQEVDADMNPTRQQIAKQKVEDVKLDKQARAQVIAAVAVVAGIQVVKYVAMQSLKKSANDAILAKYGPELFNLLKVK